MRGNSRAAVRVRRRFKVSVVGSTSFTVDVSIGGFCVELLRVPPPGTAVDGSIDVKGRAFAFRGRVAWARGGDPRMNLRGRMGVCFIDAPSELRQSLEAAVS